MCILLERKPEGQIARWKWWVYYWKECHADGQMEVVGVKARWPDGSGGRITIYRKEAVDNRECSIFEIYA